MTIKKFHKTLEAVLFTGDNVAEVQELIGETNFEMVDPEDCATLDNAGAVASAWDTYHSIWLEVCPNEWVMRFGKGNVEVTPADALVDDGWTEVTA
jgi:hypothetical protein